MGYLQWFARRCRRWMMVMAVSSGAGCTLAPGIGFEPGPAELHASSSDESSGETTGERSPTEATASNGNVAVDEESSSDGADVRFDVGTIPDGATQDVPCGAVDLLFVVDDSGSMGDEQLNLVASFPGFIEGIESLLGETTDWHVGVVTTDAYEFNPPGCDRIGALVDRTGGDLSSAAVCGPFADGGRYMTTADELAEAFSCAAKVGIDGSGIERPMDAIAEALHDPQGDVSACNYGFLREGALLVLVLITDEEDSGDSLGDPASWYEAIVSARSGDPAKVVMLSLVGHPKPNECIDAQWTGMMGAEISPRLIELTEMFEHGLVRDVCAADYGGFFEEALLGIADACEVPAQG